uniref:3'(2'),5'-bisphosphate nucleotidase CysQ n=1 Tax=Macrostomum lignano TaxID=282301 RepID=A0A1I8IXU5_9PLAT
MKVSDLIAELLNAAEKSAELARAIRREESLFHLLIEEKTGDDKNKRFGFDFKTLADVLVQEMIRFDLNKKTATIELPPRWPIWFTKTLLCRGRPNWRNWSPLELDKKEIGIWIDPIDGTAEYISGRPGPGIPAWREHQPERPCKRDGADRGCTKGPPACQSLRHQQPFFKTEDGKIEDWPLSAPYDWSCGAL